MMSTLWFVVKIVYETDGHTWDERARHYHVITGNFQNTSFTN